MVSAPVEAVPLETAASSRVLLAVRVLAPVIVGVVAAALGIWRLMPGVGFWDTAEFQTVPPILGTAHPVKFPDAVEKAGVGKALELPAHLSDLFERDERCTVLPNDLKAVQAFVSQHGNRGKPL